MHHFQGVSQDPQELLQSARMRSSISPERLSKWRRNTLERQQMKRLLVEILCGLAVVVLMVSFNHQIGQLKEQNQEVAQLRSMIAETSSSTSSKTDITTVRSQLMQHMDNRLATMEAQLTEVHREAEEANCLKDEIDATRREATLLKAEYSRDISRTQELVDTYQAEIRARGRNTRETLEKTKTALSKLQLDALSQPSTEQLHRAMLSPTVQLNGEDTVGSGTLIYSRRTPRSGKNESYVITSYHVVRNILADSPRASREGISVTVYNEDGQLEVRADMICHDERIDAALLRLRSKQIFTNVAAILPRELAADLSVWDPICAVGCPLGNDPIPTTGQLSSKRNVLNGSNYWMINAPTYYGNSGGGVYASDRRMLIGVFSKIYTHGRGNPVVVPHMGLCTPITAVYEWLDREKLGFVLKASTVSMPSENHILAPAPGK